MAGLSAAAVALMLACGRGGPGPAGTDDTGAVPDAPDRPEIPGKGIYQKCDWEEQGWPAVEPGTLSGRVDIAELRMALIPNPGGMPIDIDWNGDGVGDLMMPNMYHDDEDGDRVWALNSFRQNWLAWSQPDPDDDACGIVRDDDLSYAEWTLMVDWNGDGFDDIVTGRSDVGNDPGHFAWQLGPLPDGITKSAPQYTVQNDFTDLLTIAVLGDVDDDGVTELLTAVAIKDEPYRVIVLDPDDPVEAASEVETVLEGGEYDVTSNAPVFAGDMDGDGVDDVLVKEGLANITYLVPGPISGFAQTEDVATASIRADDGYGLFGIGRSFGFDANDDGHLDLAFGDSWGGDGTSENGQAWLFLGPMVGERSASEASTAAFTATTVGSDFGENLDMTSDLDGDGALDLSVAAPNWDEADTEGALFTFYGPFSGQYTTRDAETLVVRAEKVNSIFPRELRPAGDMDGDGFDDLWFTATGDGVLHLLFGAPR